MKARKTIFLIISKVIANLLALSENLLAISENLLAFTENPMYYSM